MSLARKWGPWLVLVVIAGIGLTIGLESRHSPPLTLQAQVMHIAGQVRCPVCQGETAAQSQASESVEIRAIIQQDLQKGESSNQILQSLVASFGPGILEKPPAKGISALVWALPVAGFIVAAVALFFLFRRWRRAAPGELGGEGSGPAGDLDPAGGGAPVLAGRAPAPDRPLETGSIDAGSVDADPVDAGSVDAGSVDSGRPVRVRRRVPGGRRAKIVVTCTGVLLIAGGASWAVAGSAGTRLPGEEITGAALGSEQIEADLDAAEADEQKSPPDVTGAIQQYQKVLASEPTQVEALTGEGWLLVQTGQPSLVQNGLSMLRTAETTEPTYAPAHVYRGIGLVAEGDYSDSIPELQWYLAHDPDPSLVTSVKKELAEAQAAVAAAAKATSPTDKASG